MIKLANEDIKNTIVIVGEPCKLQNNLAIVRKLNDALFEMSHDCNTVQTAVVNYTLLAILLELESLVKPYEALRAKVLTYELKEEEGEK